MCNSTASRPVVQPVTLTNADYHRAVARVLEALRQLEEAAEHCLAMPPSGYTANGMHGDGWSTWEMACVNLNGLAWAAGAARNFLETLPVERNANQPARRIGRDDATMPTTYPDPDDCCDLAALAAEMA